MSQISTKFIQDNAVTGAKIRLNNNEMLRFRNAAGTADINIAKGNTSDQFEFQLIPIVANSVPVPNALKQLATVEYVQNYINGKGTANDAVRALADTNIPLTGSTPLVIDGVTLINNDRVLLTAQTSAVDNGPYTLAISGGTYTLTVDPSWSSTSNPIQEGEWFVVVEGTVYSGYEALLTTQTPVWQTTPLTFAKYPSTASMTADDMLKRIGNSWSVDLASLGGLVSTSPGNPGGQLKVLTDAAVLEQDQTTRLDPSTGAVMAKASRKAVFILASQDITNQYVDLPRVAGTDSVDFRIGGAPTQYEGVDYNVNYTGGTSSKTRVSFAGGLATAGVSALAVGDVAIVHYMAF